MILITGFEPFGGETENPSRLSARLAVENLNREGVSAAFLEVPVVFARAGPAVIDKAASVRADVVVCVGVAGDRKLISLERTAYNVKRGRIPDNDGAKPDGEIILPGPDTLTTRLPVSKALDAIKAAGIPVEISDDAGRYVCNTLLYTVVAQLPEETPAGFVHVPQASEVSIEKQAEALQIVAMLALEQVKAQTLG